jgi:hypothetical protein
LVEADLSPSAVLREEPPEVLRAAPALPAVAHETFAADTESDILAKLRVAIDQFNPWAARRVSRSISRTPSALPR